MVNKEPSCFVKVESQVSHVLCFVQVQHYLDFACCAAIPNCGTNKEFALHLLYLCRGDIKVSIKSLTFVVVLM